MIDINAMRPLFDKLTSTFFNATFCRKVATSNERWRPLAIYVEPFETEQISTFLNWPRPQRDKYCADYLSFVNATFCRQVAVKMATQCEIGGAVWRYWPHAGTPHTHNSILTWKTIYCSSFVDYLDFDKWNVLPPVLKKNISCDIGDIGVICEVEYITSCIMLLKIVRLRNIHCII